MGGASTTFCCCWRRVLWEVAGWWRKIITMGSSGHAREGTVNAVIHMDGVGWKIYLWNFIDEHGGFSQKHIPVIQANAIPSFPTTDSGKIEWAMDVRIVVG